MMDPKIKLIAKRIDYILKSNSDRPDQWQLRTDLKELLTEIENSIKQDEATK